MHTLQGFPRCTVRACCRGGLGFFYYLFMFLCDQCLFSQVNTDTLVSWGSQGTCFGCVSGWSQAAPCLTSYPEMSHRAQPPAPQEQAPGSRLLFPFVLLYAGHVMLWVLINLSLAFYSLLLPREKMKGLCSSFHCHVLIGGWTKPERHGELWSLGMDRASTRVCFDASTVCVTLVSPWLLSVDL